MPVSVCIKYLYVMKYTFVVEKKCTIRYRNMISVYILCILYKAMCVYLYVWECIYINVCACRYEYVRVLHMCIY